MEAISKKYNYAAYIEWINVMEELKVKIKRKKGLDNKSDPLIYSLASSKVMPSSYLSN